MKNFGIVFGWQLETDNGMNNKEKFNSILTIIIGVILVILVYKFVMNNAELTTQDIMDRIEEVPLAQDKGLIFDDQLITVINS